MIDSGGTRPGVKAQELPTNFKNPKETGHFRDITSAPRNISSYPDVMLMRLPVDSDLRKPLGVMRDPGQTAAATVKNL
jgi:hypothetical protein